MLSRWDETSINSVLTLAPPQTAPTDSDILRNIIILITLVGLCLKCAFVILIKIKAI